MQIETDVLVEIIEKASSIQDRLNGAFVPAESPVKGQAADVEARLQQWCQNVTKGDSARFKNRFLWDGIDLETVRAVLGPVRLKDSQFRPRWAQTLGEILTGLSLALPDDYQSADDRCLDQSTPVPFEEVWLPFVQFA